MTYSWSRVYNGEACNDIRWVNVFWDNLIYIAILYIFLPAVGVLIVSVIDIYSRVLSNYIDYCAYSVIRITHLDTSKIAVSPRNDAVGETGVSADTCNSHNTDRCTLLNDP